MFECANWWSFEKDVSEKVSDCQDGLGLVCCWCWVFFVGGVPPESGTLQCGLLCEHAGKKSAGWECSMGHRDVLDGHCGFVLY